MRISSAAWCGTAAFLSSLALGAPVLAANWNPLPDTGQTQCYDADGNAISCPAAGENFYGQDASYQGKAPSYTVNDDGTVKDNNTELMWQQSDDGAERTWDEAKAYCEQLNFAGYSDWRLPELMELESIRNYHSIVPLIDTSIFQGTFESYWAENAVSFNNEYKWYIDIRDFPLTTWMEGIFPVQVRCVRGDKTSMGTYIDNGDKTVSDKATGLIWQQQLADIDQDGTSDIMTWDDAIAWCENLTSAGHSHWRLPNIREMLSLSDRSRYQPAIDPIFQTTSDSAFWSSTSYPSYLELPQLALGVESDSGTTVFATKCLGLHVRCVCGGLPGDEITAQNYSFGNVDPRSDRFSVWMDNVTINGETPTWQHFCGDYYISVEGDNGKGADMKECGCVACTNDDDLHTPDCDCVRYRIDFEIDKDKTYPTAAYFENGVIKFTDAVTGKESTLKGIESFSIYGTTFNLEEDAWNFKNGSWRTAKHNAEEYRKIISNEIDEEDDRDTNIGGSRTRKDFNAHVGISELFGENSISKGLCYGLASSAIANFTRKQSLYEYWGEEGTKNWKNEMDKHWDWDNNIAKSPFKPFRALSPAHPMAAPKNIYDLTWGDSAKMVMYYFAAQSSFLNSSETNSANWVGKDNGRIFGSMADRTDELILSDTLLKKGRPVLTMFPDHAVVLLQLLRWSENVNKNTVYMFWDNNHPYNGDAKNGLYAEWHISDKNGGYLSANNAIKMINNDDRDKSKILQEVKSVNEISFMFPCINSIKESQNIYNLWNEPCLELPATETAEFAAKSAKAQTSASTTYSAPDHIEVMFIGGTINGIYNQATDEKINPVFSDSLQPGQAAIQSTMGGTYHLIHLPADATYRVEATKAADMPYAEVYATIPNTDGTVEKLYYDNIGFSETDATKFSFVVGRGNSDRVVHRTGGSDKTPDYDISLDMAITPPSSFAGFAAGGQVQLSWENSSHPKLSLVKVVRKQNGFPASPSDGTEVYSGLAENATDSTAASNTLYYYAAFSMDSSGNYSDSATAAVDTVRFAVTGLVTNSGAGLPNAKVEIRNSEQFPVAMTYSRADGSYVFANLENDSYTVTAEASGYHMDSSPKSVAINNANQTADFTSTAVPALQFVFDIDKLNIGTQAQIAWKYLHVNSGETILVQKVSEKAVTNLAELPASSSQVPPAKPVA